MTTKTEKMTVATNRIKIQKLIKDNLYPSIMKTEQNGDIICRWSAFGDRVKDGNDYVAEMEKLLAEYHIAYHVLYNGIYQTDVKLHIA